MCPPGHGISLVVAVQMEAQLERLVHLQGLADQDQRAAQADVADEGDVGAGPMQVMLFLSP